MEFNSKKEIVKSIQAALGLTPDGIDGPSTWAAISSKMGITATVPASTNSIVSDISLNAYNLILQYEVGGGENYYNKELKHPSYPGGESGVTIGIGYDLGYNTPTQFATDWKAVLDSTSYERLVPHLGKKSSTAKAAIPSVKDICIAWDSAQAVFKSNTLPRFIKETVNAFPGSQDLHPDAFGALVSLVFNRGGSTSGASRAEMLNIKNAIAAGHPDIYNYIAGQIIGMKRLWVGKGLDGLLTRRDDEAKLIRSCS